VARVIVAFHGKFIGAFEEGRAIIEVFSTISVWAFDGNKGGTIEIFGAIIDVIDAGIVVAFCVAFGGCGFRWTKRN
jgi:hypothetical protein